MKNIDVTLRYKPVVEVINENREEDSKILEIGGGFTGVSNFIDDEVVCCDLCFDDDKPIKNLIPMKVDARNLPFEDNSHDFVVSSDMLEHIKDEDREKVIQEMLRVSKNYVVVGFPCGEKTEKFEKFLFNLGKKFGKEHKWIKEHIENGLPKEEEILKYFGNKFIEVKGNANLKLWIFNELFSLIYLPWLFYPIFVKFIDKGSSYRKIFIVSK